MVASCSNNIVCLLPLLWVVLDTSRAVISPHSAWFARISLFVKIKCCFPTHSVWSALQKLQASRPRFFCFWFFFWNLSFFESRCPSSEVCWVWQCWLVFWLRLDFLLLSLVARLSMQRRVKTWLSTHNFSRGDYLGQVCNRTSLWPFLLRGERDLWTSPLPWSWSYNQDIEFSPLWYGLGVYSGNVLSNILLIHGLCKLLNPLKTWWSLTFDPSSFVQQASMPGGDVNGLPALVALLRLPVMLCLNLAIQCVEHWNHCNR